MGMASNDPVVTQSSIALLQERFRQLQRVKEIREERELSSRMVAEPKQLFIHPDLILQPACARSSPPSISLSLWPNTQNRHANLRGMETPLLMSLRPAEKPSKLASLNKSDDSGCDDIDTSLHL